MDSAGELESRFSKFIEERRVRLLEKLAAGIDEPHRYWELVGAHKELKNLQLDLKELYKKLVNE